MKTIDELVRLFHPDFVSVDNVHGYALGTLFVRSFKVEYDDDGVHMYVVVEDNLEKCCVAMMERG